MGLKIEGRWASNESRWKFTSRHAKGMIRDIANKVKTLSTQVGTTRKEFVKEQRVCINSIAVLAYPILHCPMHILHTSSGCIEESMWAGPTRRYKKGLST
jgi:hypothetical protein